MDATAIILRVSGGEQMDCLEDLVNLVALELEAHRQEWADVPPTHQQQISYVKRSREAYLECQLKIERLLRSEYSLTHPTLPLREIRIVPNGVMFIYRKDHGY